MVLLDLDGGRAAAVADQHGAGKATADAVDARAAGELAAGCRMSTCWSTPPPTASTSTRWAPACGAGCHYLDLGGLYWMTGRQRELGPEFERAGLLAVLGMGSSPGKTNLMAARGVAELGDDAGPIESIDVAAAGRDPVAASDGRLRPPYSIQTLLDELTLPPVVTRDGAARPRSSRSPTAA